MKLSTKIKTLIATSCVGLGALLCVYSATALKDRLIQTEYNHHQTALGLLTRALKKPEIISFSISTGEKISAYLEELRRQATQVYPLIKQPKHAPVSLLGLDYFLQSPDQAGVFYAMGELSQIKSCAALFNLSEAEYRSGLNYIQAHFGDEKNFGCLITPKQSYLAYKLPTDKEGKHYVYLKKVPHKVQLPLPNYANPQLIKFENVLKNYEFNDEAQFGVLDKQGQLIYSNVKNFDAELFGRALLDSARLSSPLRTVIQNGREDLATVTYEEEVGYGVALTPRGQVIKPAIILAFMAVCMSLIILILSLVLLNRYDKFILSHLEKLNLKLKELSANDLRDPSQLAVLTESLMTKENNEFSDLTNNLANLGKTLGESLNSVIDDTAKRNYADGVSNTLHSVLQKILPSGEDLPSSRFLDIASYLIPSRKNCGDFYDVFRIDKDNIGFLVGQISEKGAPALPVISEVMVIARNMLKYDNKRPADVLNYLNNLLVSRQPREKIKAHLFMAILSEFTGNFIASNAGMQIPLHVRGDNVSPLSIQAGVELGRDGQHIYSDYKHKLDFGDLLLLYTDGISEARNSDEETFGVKRLGDLCANPEDKTSADILIAINKSLKSFCKDLEPSQDMSVVCIKKNGWKE